MQLIKRNIIVFKYLIVQLVFGGLIMYGIFTENSADNSIVRGIMTYLGLAVGFTIVAILLHKFHNDNEVRQAYLRALVATILFWLLAWPVTVKIIDAVF